MKQHLHTLKTLLVGALTLGLLHTPFAITANDETIDTVEQVDIATVGPNTPYPIMFVTQPPIGEDFVTINSTFGNHLPDAYHAGRGGDLWIRYTDGTLKNLTQAAGFGIASGLQGVGAIEVRDPSVHWNGQKAVFSMLVEGGSSTRWQLYEIMGFATPNGIPIINKVPHQASSYNNVMPTYDTQGRIIYASDAPLGGQAHLYPQLDEYEAAAANTGLWRLDPNGGSPKHLEHSPSGSFHPIVDSFGRVVFARWDHLKRDQQVDNDWLAGVKDLTTCSAAKYVGNCGFNYSSELAGSVPISSQREIFPEPRAVRSDLLAGTNLAGGTEFQQFFPWQMNEDGSELETLNHLGRQELGGSFNPAVFKNDPNLIYTFAGGGSKNQNLIRESFAQIKEDPLRPGTYYGVNAQEFGTHNSGQIVSMTAPLNMNADLVKLTYVTHPNTASSQPGVVGNSGHYRDPLPLSDGSLIASHSPYQGIEFSHQTISAYDFRLKTLMQSGGTWVDGVMLTAGISKTFNYPTSGGMFSYSGLMWELQPTEVRPRSIPATLSAQIKTPEQQAFAQTGVDPLAFQAFLQQNNLALVVSRNTTSRDNADRQQPFNLRVAGAGVTGTQSIGAGGKIYDIAFLQILQGDLIRGLGFQGAGVAPRNNGRRVLANELHDSAAVAYNPTTTAPISGAVQIAADGSAAAFVPANRALSWQTTDAQGTPVVRERYWLSFAPGEVRTCAACHGINDVDQAGKPEPQNVPQALIDLLAYWKTTANTPTATALPPATHTPTPTATPNISPSPSPTSVSSATATAIATQAATATALPGGNFWNIVGSSVPSGSLQIRSMAFDPAGYMYIGTLGGGVSRSTDGGNTWTQVNNGLGQMYVQSLAVHRATGNLIAGTGSAISITAPIVMPNGRMILICNSCGKVWLSTNHGDSWTQIKQINNINQIGYSALETSNGNLLIGGKYGGLWVSTDAGLNWHVPTGYVNTLGAMFSFAESKTQPGLIIAGPELPGLWRSYDYGLTWSLAASNGLAGGNLIGLTFNAQGEVFAGTVHGMWRSPDVGDNWTLVAGGNTGLISWESYYSLATAPDGTMFAGSRTGFAQRSVNNGATWQAVTSGMPVGVHPMPILTAPNGCVYASYMGSVNLFKANGFCNAPPVGTPLPTLTPTQTPTPTATKTWQPYAFINFQPVTATAALPNGYLIDSGAMFGYRGNGFYYGWNITNPYFRDRNAVNSPDQRYDTFAWIFWNSSNFAWDIAVPNGSYKVRVVSGDAINTFGTYATNVEGTLVISGTPTVGNYWLEGTATVNVTDGKLTLTNAPGAMNNKLNFVEIWK